MTKRRSPFAATCAAALTLVVAATEASADDALVVYCGRGEALVGPLLERYEKASGRELDVRYNSTAALATQLVTEADASPADVAFFQDSGYLGAVADAGLLATLPDELLDQVDERFRDPDGRWVGTSGRARVMVYDSAQVAPESLPATLAELADPKWKGKLGWAPSNSSFQAHVSALRHTWGDEETERWLTAMKDNEPKVYPKNSPQVLAANDGEIAIGWVNHYYLHRLRTDDFNARNASFRTAGDIGNLLMVSGVGVREGSPRRDAALNLVRFLVGPEAAAYFAQESFEYPVRPGVETHEGVPSLDSLGLATVDQRALADVGPTLELLEKLGLQ